MLCLTGCKDTGYKAPNPTRAAEAPERDCRKVGDRVCVLTINGKERFYCYAGKWPKVVKARKECV